MHNRFFFGTTNKGGADGLGTLFQVAPDGTSYETDYTFQSEAPGITPGLQMTLASNGKLYGVSWQGGVYDAGVLYEYDPVTNIYAVRHSFNTPDGKESNCTLTEYDGKLYGLTFTGGAFNQGVLFAFDYINGGYAIMHDFIDSTGSFPSGGGLTVWNGKMYGGTAQGGQGGSGVIFEFDPVTRQYTVKIAFDGSNGANLQNTMLEYQGKLYGLASQGGAIFGNGLLFEYDPSSNQYTIKVIFDAMNGANPQGSLTLLNGKLYGTTASGGLTSNGVLFKYDPLTGVYTKLWDFTWNGGAIPETTLAVLDEKLYGLTEGGGDYGYGVLFRYDPLSGAYDVLHPFDPAGGVSPIGSLTVANSKLYGTTSTSQDPANNFLEIRSRLFEFDPGTNQYSVKKIFNFSEDGNSPGAGLTRFNDKLYGVTSDGGAYDQGTLYEYRPSTKTYTKKKDFQNNTGVKPWAKLTRFGDKLYGMATTGGTAAAGVIFEYDPVTDHLQTVKQFLGTDGRTPMEGLTPFNGKLYGTTQTGGSADKGVLFSFDPLSGQYVKLWNFIQPEGSHPSGSLTLFQGKFYGITSSGGLFGNGVVFEYDPVANAYLKKQDISCCIWGSHHWVVCHDKLYLLSSGFSPLFIPGAIIEYDPIQNALSTKKMFDSNDGYDPTGNFIEFEGKLYALTNSLGQGGGALFRYEPENDQLTVLLQFDKSTGYAPLGDLSVFDPLSAAGEPATQVDILSVYPNPASDILKVTNRFDGSGLFDIFHTDGRKAVSIRMSGFDHKNIDVSKWSSGLYLWSWSPDNARALIQTGSILVHK